MADKSICFIVNGYPTKDNPEYAFIRPVVCGLADLGVKCTVIAPQSISNLVVYKKKVRKEKWQDTTDAGNIITILQPKFISTSNIQICGINLGITSKIKAIKRSMKRYHVIPDVMYGHFWQSAIVAAAATENKIPVIAVSGESVIRVRENFSAKIIGKCLPAVKGMIAVSSKNLNESKELGLLWDSMKSIVLPNAVDTSEFYQIDKNECRNKLGFDTNDIIVAFVGTFCERKGVLRVVEAAKGIPNLKLMFIGKGDQNPESDQIIFKGILPHEKIVNYLNAADMFVLPTQAEGCCNAIIEALSCGLPVISSNLDFNADILNAGNSVMVDPNSIEQIHEALNKLASDTEAREKLSRNALATAENLKIETRCKRILDFIWEVV